MATVQQSIDIRIPVHTAYNQLTQFEDYPQFMEEVEAVQQLDDTHLHWRTMMSNRAVEWDAEITEQEPDRCIAWHNTSGPTSSARVEVQPLGQDASRITFTLESEPQQVPGSSAGSSEQEISQRLKSDLARFKDFIERRGSETGVWRGEVQGGQVTGGQAGNTPVQAGENVRQQEGIASAQGERGSPRNSSAPTSSYAAGSEGWSGDENPTSPVTSAGRNATGQGTNATSRQGGGTSAVVGAAGGTDASAGARLSGSKGAESSTGQRSGTDATGAPGTPGGAIGGNAASPAAGAAAAGGTGLGETASASDTRTGTGTSSGSGASLTGGGTSGARDPGKGRGA
ncbi:MAG TPA: SRPBCC family protein [Noviherbaspirillum sp.]|nr:SRPBCC family protein [Noviherbaspirillum sp.]